MERRLHWRRHLHDHNLRFQAGDCNLWAPADRDADSKRDADCDRDAEADCDRDAEAERNAKRDADARAAVDDLHRVPPAYQSTVERRRGVQQRCGKRDASSDGDCERDTTGDGD